MQRGWGEFFELEKKKKKEKKTVYSVLSQQLKSKVGLALAKAAALRITLNLDGAPITSKSHTHPSHS